MIIRHREIKEKFGIFMPPAVGYSLPVLYYLLSHYKTELKYIPRAAVITLINLINSPFRLCERTVTNKKIKSLQIKHDPVFIIGHWRSGTKLLHNLLTQDQQMAYVSTYQSVFPESIFIQPGKFIFKNFTDILIPSTREGDNVRLNPDFPQEEEFTLGSKNPSSYYYFWFFPKKTLEFYDNFINHQNINSRQLENWKRNYKTLIKKACLNTGKPVFLSKNPPNTARIKLLLEIFPNAKFIHIHRNPVLVFLSTMKFYTTMMPHLQFHSISKEQLQEYVIMVYKNLMHQFLKERNLIPEKNFIELQFEELESKPLVQLEKIYNELDISGFNTSKPAFERYIEATSGYKKNKHNIKKETLEKIQHEWSFTMKEWNYDIPESIDVE